MEIKNHWLAGEGVIKHPSPNTGGKFNPGACDTVLMHYTAGASGESSVQTLCNPAVQASAHIVIDRDGTIYQLIPFDTIAWHAGRSEYNGRKGYNQFSIGIELDNAGRLTRTQNGYQSWFGRNYAPDDVVAAVHRNEHQPDYWQVFTEPQIQQADVICRLLIDTYGIQHILGHEEVSPGRKCDPGPAFPLDVFRQKLIDADRNETDGLNAEELPESVMVNVSELNFRAGPGTSHSVVSKPLARNTPLRVLEKNGQWFRVVLETEGWVHGDYVEKV